MDTINFDILKIFKKKCREEEIKIFNKQIYFKPIIQKNKKIYNRKQKYKDIFLTQ